MQVWQSGPPVTWNARSGALLAILLLSFAAVVGRLVTLGTVQAAEHASRARRNTLVEEPISPPRGRILDRKGRLLVTSTPVYDLVVIPIELRRPGAESRALAAAAGLDPDKAFQLVAQRLKTAPLEELVLARALNPASLTRLSRLTEQMAGAHVRARGERSYKHGKLASHLLGTMGAITGEELRDRRAKGYSGQDFLGKTGLEKQYEDRLRGRKGTRQLSVDATGRTLSSRVTRSPIPGSDLYLTLDLRLQDVTERALSRSLQELKRKNGASSAASAVVVSVKTGEVLAMASLPS